MSRYCYCWMIPLLVLSFIQSFLVNAQFGLNGAGTPPLDKGRERQSELRRNLLARGSQNSFSRLLDPTKNTVAGIQTKKGSQHGRKRKRRRRQHQRHRHRSLFSQRSSSRRLHKLEQAGNLSMTPRPYIINIEEETCTRQHNHALRLTCDPLQYALRADLSLGRINGEHQTDNKANTDKKKNSLPSPVVLVDETTYIFGDQTAPRMSAAHQIDTLGQEELYATADIYQEKNSRKQESHIDDGFASLLQFGSEKVNGENQQDQYYDDDDHGDEYGEEDEDYYDKEEEEEDEEGSLSISKPTAPSDHELTSLGLFSRSSTLTNLSPENQARKAYLRCAKEQVVGLRKWQNLRSNAGLEHTASSSSSEEMMPSLTSSDNLMIRQLAAQRLAYWQLQDRNKPYTHVTVSPNVTHQWQPLHYDPEWKARVLNSSTGSSRLLLKNFVRVNQNDTAILETAETELVKIVEACHLQCYNHSKYFTIDHEKNNICVCETKLPSCAILSSSSSSSSSDHGITSVPKTIGKGLDRFFKDCLYQYRDYEQQHHLLETNNNTTNDSSSFLKYKPLGAFRDTQGGIRALRYQSKERFESPQQCYSHCTQLNYSYFALQDYNNVTNTSACFCENDIAHATKYGTARCTSRGGSYCNYIYEIHSSFSTTQSATSSTLLGGRGGITKEGKLDSLLNQNITVVDPSLRGKSWFQNTLFESKDTNITETVPKFGFSIELWVNISSSDQHQHTSSPKHQANSSFDQVNIIFGATQKKLATHHNHGSVEDILRGFAIGWREASPTSKPHDDWSPKKETNVRDNKTSFNSKEQRQQGYEREIEFVFGVSPSRELSLNFNHSSSLNNTASRKLLAEQRKRLKKRFANSMVWMSSEGELSSQVTSDITIQHNPFITNPLQSSIVDFDRWHHIVATYEVILNSRSCQDSEHPGLIERNAESKVQTSSNLSSTFQTPDVIVPLGGYKDETKEPSLPYRHPVRVSSKDQCYHECSQRKYSYFALQDYNGVNNSACFCGNDFHHATKYGKSEDCGEHGGFLCNFLYEIRPREGSLQLAGSTHVDDTTENQDPSNDQSVRIELYIDGRLKTRVCIAGAGAIDYGLPSSTSLNGGTNDEIDDKAVFQNNNAPPRDIALSSEEADFAITDVLNTGSHRSQQQSAKKNGLCNADEAVYLLSRAPPRPTVTKTSESSDKMSIEIDDLALWNRALSRSAIVAAAASRVSRRLSLYNHATVQRLQETKTTSLSRSLSSSGSLELLNSQDFSRNDIVTSVLNELNEASRENNKMDGTTTINKKSGISKVDDEHFDIIAYFSFDKNHGDTTKVEGTDHNKVEEVANNDHSNDGIHHEESFHQQRPFPLHVIRDVSQTWSVKGVSSQRTHGLGKQIDAMSQWKQSMIRKLMKERKKESTLLMETKKQDISSSSRQKKKMMIDGQEKIFGGAIFKAMEELTKNAAAASTIIPNGNTSNVNGTTIPLTTSEQNETVPHWDDLIDMHKLFQEEQNKQEEKEKKDAFQETNQSEEEDDDDNSKETEEESRRRLVDEIMEAKRAEEDSSGTHLSLVADLDALACFDFITLEESHANGGNHNSVNNGDGNSDDETIQLSATTFGPSSSSTDIKTINETVSTKSITESGTKATLRLQSQLQRSLVRSTEYLFEAREAQRLDEEAQRVKLAVSSLLKDQAKLNEAVYAKERVLGQENAAQWARNLDSLYDEHQKVQLEREQLLAGKGLVLPTTSTSTTTTLSSTKHEHQQGVAHDISMDAMSISAQEASKIFAQNARVLVGMHDLLALRSGSKLQVLEELYDDTRQSRRFMRELLQKLIEVQKSVSTSSSGGFGFTMSQLQYLFVNERLKVQRVNGFLQTHLRNGRIRWLQGSNQLSIALATFRQHIVELGNGLQHLQGKIKQVTLDIDRSNETIADLKQHLQNKAHHERQSISLPQTATKNTATNDGMTDTHDTTNETTTQAKITAQDKNLSKTLVHQQKRIEKQYENSIAMLELNTKPSVMLEMNARQRLHTGEAPSPSTTEKEKGNAEMEDASSGDAIRVDDLAAIVSSLSSSLSQVHAKDSEYYKSLLPLLANQANLKIIALRKERGLLHRVAKRGFLTLKQAVPLLENHAVFAAEAHTIERERVNLLEEMSVQMEAIDALLSELVKITREASDIVLPHDMQSLTTTTEQQQQSQSTSKSSTTNLTQQKLRARAQQQLVQNLLGELASPEDGINAVRYVLHELIHGSSRYLSYAMTAQRSPLVKVKSLFERLGDTKAEQKVIDMHENAKKARENLENNAIDHMLTSGDSNDSEDVANKSELKSTSSKSTKERCLYEVKRGDSLESISDFFQVDISSLRPLDLNTPLLEMAMASTTSDKIVVVNGQHYPRIGTIVSIVENVDAMHNDNAIFGYAHPACLSRAALQTLLHSRLNSIQKQRHSQQRKNKEEQQKLVNKLTHQLELLHVPQSYDYGSCLSTNGHLAIAIKEERPKSGDRSGKKQSSVHHHGRKRRKTMAEQKSDDASFAWSLFDRRRRKRRQQFIARRKEAIEERKKQQHLQSIENFDALKLPGKDTTLEDSNTSSNGNISSSERLRTKSDLEVANTPSTLQQVTFSMAGLPSTFAEEKED
eukprot:g1391.t1